MIEMIAGMAGAVIGIALFISGWTLGRRSLPGENRSPANTREAEAAAASERSRLSAEQHAFQELMGYSADVAYGTAKLSAEADDTL